MLGRINYRTGDLTQTTDFLKLRFITKQNEVTGILAFVSDVALKSDLLGNILIVFNTKKEKGQGPLVKFNIGVFQISKALRKLEAKAKQRLVQVIRSDDTYTLTLLLAKTQIAPNTTTSTTTIKLEPIQL